METQNHKVLSSQRTERPQHPYLTELFTMAVYMFLYGAFGNDRWQYSATVLNKVSKCIIPLNSLLSLVAGKYQQVSIIKVYRFKWQGSHIFLNAPAPILIF